MQKTCFAENIFCLISVVIFVHHFFFSDDLPHFAVHVDPLCSRLPSVRWRFGVSSVFVEKVQVSRLQINCAGLSWKATDCKGKCVFSVKGLFVCCCHGLGLLICYFFTVIFVMHSNSFKKNYQ